MKDNYPIDEKIVLKLIKYGWTKKLAENRLGFFNRKNQQTFVQGFETGYKR